MPKQIRGEPRTTAPKLRRSPSGVPGELARLAQACLKGEAEDSRLGDLSEQHVRTRERVEAYLGSTPPAIALSHWAADLRYFFSAANVIVFARAVDPAMRLAEAGAREAFALELKERIMTMLNIAARKLVLLALLLVGSAFLINSAVNVWSSWRETETLIIGLQREKAEAAAKQIDQYFALVQEQIVWTTKARADSAEQRRHDYLRLMRQVSPIVEIAQLDGDGKELLRVSRLARDTMNSGTDFSNDARFEAALKNKKYVGPVYFNKQSPHVSLALAHAGPNPGVTLAEINIKRLWEIVDTVKVGETGYIYVVDTQGRLIASRDRELVLRQSDLSDLPQVRNASAVSRSGSPGEIVTFDTSLSGAAVISVHAPLRELGWNVFVELPVAEARAPLWSAVIRAVILLGLGLLAIALASFATMRRHTPAQPART